ncbi:MAG: XRE family transcriptional regulator [Oscillospiraceae bacterium]
MNFSSKDAPISEIIRHMLTHRNMSVTDLANLLDTTRQNMNGKLSRNNFCQNDLYDIASALGYEVIINFVDKKED